jgi:hypothetical protein
MRRSLHTLAAPITLLALVLMIAALGQMMP